MNNSLNNINVLDLFCGCGGLSLGFQRAGFSIVAGIDSWQDALITHKKNLPSAKGICTDLFTITPEEIKSKYGIDDIDVIIGGPPCQGFSIAGKRIVDDKRNKLYKSFVNFVRFFQPRAFVMENVPNLLSLAGGIVRDAIIEDFTNLGYNVTYKILTASDYGTPQNRRRVFLLDCMKLINNMNFPNQHLGVKISH